MGEIIFCVFVGACLILTGAILNLTLLKESKK